MLLVSVKIIDILDSGQGLIVPRLLSILALFKFNRLFAFVIFFWLTIHVETVPYTTRKHFVFLSRGKEARTGDALFERRKAEEFKGTILPAEHRDSVRVASIFGTIMKAAMHKADLEGFNSEIFVVDKPIINAFCSYGGKIVIYSGLLEKFRTDAEIATVIGHEVAHLIARHVAETIAKKKLLTIPRLLLDWLFSNRGLSDLLLMLPLSRRLEFEADYIGMFLMASAGYDPRVAPQVYAKFGNVSLGDIGEDEEKEFRSTHPSNKKRATLLAQPRVMNEALSIFREMCCAPISPSS